MGNRRKSVCSEKSKAARCADRREPSSSLSSHVGSRALRFSIRAAVKLQRELRDKTLGSAPCFLIEAGSTQCGKSSPVQRNDHTYLNSCRRGSDEPRRTLVDWRARLASAADIDAPTRQCLNSDDFLASCRRFRSVTETSDSFVGLGTPRSACITAGPRSLHRESRPRRIWLC